jgi:hypothetical protein
MNGDRGTVLLALCVSRDDGGAALQKYFSYRESRYVCNVRGENAGSANRRCVLGADRSMIRVILDKRADQVGRAFNSRNDRCTTAQPRAAASRSAGDSNPAAAMPRPPASGGRG